MTNGEIINNMKKDFFIILFILIISIFPRLWQLTNYPPLIVDEPANMRDINKLLSYNSFHPIDYEWGFGQATLVQYPALILVKLGFEELSAVRLTSVILSLASLIPFYFIVKKRTDSLIAFCTTILFSFSYYFLQFSRVGWTNIHSLCLGLFLLWLVDMATVKKSLVLILISGLLAGILLYLYRSGEIYILAALILLILELRKIKNIKMRIKNVGVFIFAFIVISLPWINKIFINWDLYNLRSRVVSINNATFPYHGLSNHKDIMIYQITATFKAWILMLPVNGGGIEDPRYLPLNHGIVSPIIALLFFMGLILSIYKFRENLIWLFIYFSGLIFGQILTVDPPNGSRGLILLPIIYIFASLGLFYIYKRFKKYPMSKSILILGTFIVSLSDFYFYTEWMHWIKV